MKTVLITGATSGIGLATAKLLDNQGYRQIWLIRNPQKARELLAKLNPKTEITLIACDLADLGSVKQAAAQILENVPHVDVLINNAGGMFQQKNMSLNGYELTFAMNHLGHFLLTTLLINRLIAGKARIINVSSEGHRMAKNIDLNDLPVATGYSPLKAYGNAKLCNVYFTKELNRRFADKGITSYALHPGVVRTGFGNDTKGFFSVLLAIMKPFMLTPEKGAATSFFLATEPGIENLSGQYFKNRKPVKPSPEALDADMAQKVWALSEELVQPFL